MMSIVHQRALPQFIFQPDGIAFSTHLLFQKDNKFNGCLFLCYLFMEKLLSAESSLVEFFTFKRRYWHRPHFCFN